MRVRWTTRILLAWLTSCAVAWAHGGTYAGPGSGVPGAGPTTPAPQRPPGQPAGSTPTAGAPGGAGAANTGFQLAGPDLADWRTWWALQRDTFLNLREALQKNAVTTTDDAFFGLGGALERGDGARPRLETVRDRVRPVLLAALADERNPDVLSGVLLALGKLGEPRTDPEGRIRPALARHLADGNQEVAESAALSLGVLGDGAAVTLLNSLVRDEASARTLLGGREVPQRTRAFAAYGLGLIGARVGNADVRRYAAQALLHTLAHDTSRSHDLRVAAALGVGLVRIEPEFVDEAVVNALPSASREHEVRWLTAQFGESSITETVRLHLPVAAARLTHGGRPLARAELVQALLAVLEPESRASDALQQGCLTALGLCGDNDADPLDRRVLETLLRRTREGDALGRRQAWMALARVGARAGANEGREEGTRRVRAALLKGLAEEGALLRPWIALALGVFEHARLQGGALVALESTQALRAALEAHGGPTEAGAYCLALGLCRDTAAAPRILVEARRTQDDELQSQAALALGLLGERSVVEPLRAVALESRHRPIVLRDTAIALGLLGDHELVATLIVWLREASNLGVLSATAGALGWVGDARAVEPLCLMVESDTVPDQVRAFAAVALGLISDKDLLPWNTLIKRDLNLWRAPASLTEPLTATGVIELY